MDFAKVSSGLDLGLRKSAMASDLVAVEMIFAAIV